MRIVQKQFTGGISEGSRRGFEGAVQDAIGIDYRTNPDEVTLLPKLKSDTTPAGSYPYKMIEVDGHVFTDSITALLQRNTGGTWSTKDTFSNVTGHGIGYFNECLWFGYASNTASPFTSSLNKVTDPKSTFSIEENYFETASFEYISSAQRQFSGAIKYNLKTSISELAVDKFNISGSGIVSGIVMNVATIGSSVNWTITLHDSSDNIISQTTIPAADLATGQGFYRLQLPPTTIPFGGLHIHVTASATTGTPALGAGTSNDLSTGHINPLTILTGQDIDQSNYTDEPFYYVGGGSGVYNLTTNISEADTSRLYFTPEHSLLSAVSFMTYFGSSAATDITITIHDGFNNEVASVELDSYNTYTTYAGTFTKFDFDEPVRLNVGQEYHLHVHRSSATGDLSLVTGTNQDLNTVKYKTHYNILNDTDYFPMQEFQNLLCIGNGNVLSTIDDSEVFEKEAVVLPDNFTIRALEVIGGYLAIAANNYILFWDGTSTTFTDFIKVNGTVKAIRNDGNNYMYIIHGEQATISVYEGSITKLRKIKSMRTGIIADVKPEAITIKDGLLLFALSDVSNAEVDALVYSYGRSSKEFPYSLNKDYVISTGNKGTAVDIYSLLDMESGDLFVGWHDSTTSSTLGIDKLSTEPQSSAYFTTLILDGGSPEVEKLWKDISIRMSPLATTDTITVQARYNGHGSFVTLEEPLDGSNSDHENIFYKAFNIDKRAFEIEIKITITTSSTTTSPKFFNYAIEFDKDTNFRHETKKYS